LNFYFKEKIMISPSYSLTATERVLPRMALDFTTALLDARVTFTRTGNTATVTNSSGVIVGVNADLPRFDFDPTTLVCKGLLIEEARTNVLLNSLIDGTSLTTQLVTVTAAARTFSFYGTGTVVLSGAHSATVVGTGTYPTRTTLTFTPIAGVLTLTVTGTVQFAQLELGAFPTSYIPTEASQVTRTADVATMTGTNFSDFYNVDEGSIFTDATTNAASSVAISFNDGSNTNQMRLLNSSSGVSAVGTSAGSTIFSMGSASQLAKICFGYALNNYAVSVNGNTPATDVLGNLPIALDRVRIGARADGVTPLNGHIRKFFYYPQRLTNAELQAFSK
jgi:hypothetical protein